METNKSKYITNPLDPEVERKSQEEWGDGSDGKGATQRVQGPTGQVVSASQDARQNVYSEAPTRRYENPPLEAPYPSIFVPPTYAPPTQHQPRQNIYQPPPSAQPTSRQVLGIGLPEKFALVLPYAPFYIGLIVSLLELFLVPRKETKVRFHASQALALHLGILIIHTVFGVISTITDSSLGGTLFKLAATVFLIVSMVRVAKGESHHIAPLDEPAQWFNRHIEPRNQ